jgi:uncharacterized protein YybS (DUF2232 family)
MTTTKLTSGGGHKLTAILFGIAGSGLLFSAGLVLPILGFAAAFIAPAPLGLTRLRTNLLTTVFCALLTSLIMAVLFSPFAGVWYAVQCGLAGTLIPHLALNGLSAFRTILWTTAISVTGLLLLAILFFSVTGQNPQIFVENGVENGTEMAVKLYEQAGMGQQELELLQQGLQVLGDFMTRSYPALASIHLGLIAACTLLIFNRTATRLGLTLNPVQLREFRSPDYLIWVLIASGFGLLAPTGLIAIPALNLLMLPVVIYFFQGLAVLLTLTDRSSMSGFLKFMLAMLLFIQPYLAAVVAAVGIFDFWGDFRTPRIPPQQENL